MALSVSRSSLLTDTPTDYAVVWSVNGVAQPAVLVPFVAGQAAYSLAYSGTLSPGAVDGATVQAVGGAGTLPSNVVPSTPATITIPTPPPVKLSDPQNVVLTLN